MKLLTKQWKKDFYNMAIYATITYVLMLGDVMNRLNGWYIGLGQ